MSHLKMCLCEHGRAEEKNETEATVNNPVKDGLKVKKREVEEVAENRLCLVALPVLIPVLRHNLLKRS